jgi:hypothetical protein
MKINILSLFLLAPYALLSQINFKTSKSESGIIKPNRAGLDIGYSFSESETRFNYSSLSSVMDTISGKNPFTGFNYKVAVPVSDGKNSIFSSGKYVPGLGLGFEYMWNKDEFKKNTRYNFVRATVDAKQIKFGSIEEKTDTAGVRYQLIDIDKKETVSAGVAAGINWLFAGKKYHDNAILAVSLAAKYNFNPSNELDAKEYVVIEKSVTNGNIQKLDKAFDGTQADYFSLNPKIDFVWTPSLTKKNGEEVGARIGLITSFSTLYNGTSGRFNWNYSVGPSIHPKWSTSNVVATIQFEFNDFTNYRNDRTFDDIFGIVFYVGIPVSLK